MKKYISISVLLIFFSCLESKEEKIVGKLSTELDSRGLEIDTIITINTTEILVSPKDYKKERWTVNLYDFMTIQNEDSLNSLIKEKADRIKAWFELPEWDDKGNEFSPWLTSRLNDPEVYKKKLTANYGLSFHHTNTKTNKTTLVGERLFSHWKMTEQNFDEWTRNYLNMRYEKEAQLVKTSLNNLEFFQLKCTWNERLPHSLIFTENFKKDASDKIGYPFYVILNNNFPVYVSNKTNLNVLKEKLKEIQSSIKQRDTFPVELITYKENGIEVSEIE